MQKDIVNRFNLEKKRKWFTEVSGLSVTNTRTVGQKRSAKSFCELKKHLPYVKVYSADLTSLP